LHRGFNYWLPGLDWNFQNIPSFYSGGKDFLSYVSAGTGTNVRNPVVERERANRGPPRAKKLLVNEQKQCIDVSLHSCTDRTFFDAVL